MRTIIALLLSIATAAIANTTLTWDQSTGSGVVGYRLYAHTNAAITTNPAVALVKVNTGTNRLVYVDQAQSGQWWFVVTALTPTAESDPSNVVIAEVPPPPQNMRTLAIQYSATLTAFTNIGFFRLRIE